MSSLAAWNPILVKIEKKLANWKNGFLIMAGRVTIIKSVLKNVPLYFLSMFKIPCGIAAKIEAIQRRFLWSDLEDKKKLHLVD